MNNRKLSIAMFAATGLLSLPLADAEMHAFHRRSSDCLEPDATSLRSRTPDTANTIRVAFAVRTRSSRATRWPTSRCSPTASHGLLFSMNTDLVDPAAPTVSHKPTDRIQLALVPFALVKNADGSVAAKADFTGLGTNTDTTGGARFVTNNQGNEYRNANHPIAYAIADGNAICAEYNYQPNNTNNTERYMECFNTAGATVMAQTKIYAKNNDDCSMNQDKSSTWVINAKAGTAANTKSRARRVARLQR